MGLRLEAFDEAAPPAAGPSADWILGHAAGLAEGIARGRAEALAEAEARGAALAEGGARALADLAWTYAEARGQVLGGIAPLVRALMDGLLPPLAAEALGPWIAEAVREAAEADLGAPRVLVHPDALAALAVRLPPEAAHALGPDPALGPGEARVALPGGETSLDVEAALLRLRHGLLPLLDAPETRRHG